LRGDITFLGSALTDDFVGIGPHGFMLTKEQWLARIRSGGLRYKSFGMGEVAARFYGGAATDTGVAVQAADVWTVYDPSEENLM